MKLSRAERLLLTQEIESTYGPGVERDLAKLRYIFGRRVMSRRDFVEGVIPIKDKFTQQLVPTAWNSVQRRLEAVRLRTQRKGEPERYATLKARQFGVTRYWLQDAIEAVVRDTYVPAIIIADEEDNAKAILEDGKIMCANMPFALPRKYENRSQLYFDKPIMGRIDIETAKAANPCRSRTYRFVHCTEPGTWTDPEKKVGSINQSVPRASGTVLSYEGTANGQGNWWYDFWWGAKNGKNGYQALFFPWHCDKGFDYSMPLNPGDAEEILSTLDDEEKALIRAGCDLAQLKWRRAQIAEYCFGDLDLFHQEYPSIPEEAWLSSGRPCFVAAHVMRAMHSCADPVFVGEIEVGMRRVDLDRRDFTFSESARGRLSVWSKPTAGRSYVIAADVADGLDHGDPSAACVLDVESGMQVAEFDGIISPSDFGRLLACLGWHYSDALIMPEIERSGIAVLDSLREEGYASIGRRQVYDQQGRVIGRKLGWSTNIKSRPLLFSAVRQAIASQDGSGISSMALCREMLPMFIDSEGREDHPAGKHDDRVFAYGIALLARKDVIDCGGLKEIEEKRPRTTDERHWKEWHDAMRDYEEGRRPEEEFA